MTKNQMECDLKRVRPQKANIAAFDLNHVQTTNK